MIKCQPWHIWREEIELLPISSRTLFSNNGLPIDLWEITLRLEGYIQDNENLLNVIRELHNLKRKPQYDVDPDYGMFPNDWTEEDYDYYEQHK